MTIKGRKKRRVWSGCGGELMYTNTRNANCIRHYTEKRKSFARLHACVYARMCVFLCVHAFVCVRFSFCRYACACVMLATVCVFVLQVVDTPGLTSQGLWQGSDVEFHKWKTLTSPGPDVILFTIRHDKRCVKARIHVISHVRAAC